MSSSSRRVWVSRCRRPTGCGGVAGQRHVDAVAREALARARRRRARAARARSAPRAPGAPRWRPCRPRRAPRAAARRRRAAASAARPCGRGSDAQLLERRVVGGRGDRRLGLARSSSMRSSVLMRGAILRELVQRDRRRHRGVQRLAGDRDVRRRVACGDDLGGSPSRSAPTSSVDSPSDRPAQRRRPRARRARPLAGQLGRRPPRARAARRRSRPCSRARPSARTGRRSPGRARRSRRRRRAPRAARADVAGVARRRAGRRTAGPPGATQRCS